MEKENTIKAIKGFNDKLQCRGLQYEIGKEYSLEDGKTVVPCVTGFHAIGEEESPLGVFEYYAPSIDGKRSRYCEVELSGETLKHDDKIVGSKIKIGAEIGIIGLIKAHFEWVRSRITNENNAEPGKAATAGYKGAATAGYKGAATAGYEGAATAGDCGAATSKGSVKVGDYGVGTVRAERPKIMGGKGAMLTVARESETGNAIVEWKSFVIDDEKFKPDTWYTIANGEIVEAKEEAINEQR